MWAPHKILPSRLPPLFTSLSPPLISRERERETPQRFANRKSLSLLSLSLSSRRRRHRRRRGHGRLRQRDDAGEPGRRRDAVPHQGPARQRAAAQAGKPPPPPLNPSCYNPSSSPDPPRSEISLHGSRPQMGQGHPTGLTPNLLKLFEPRPPLDFKPPVEKRKLPAYTGIFPHPPHLLFYLFGSRGIMNIFFSFNFVC